MTAQANAERGRGCCPPQSHAPGRHAARAPSPSRADARRGRWLGPPPDALPQQQRAGAGQRRAHAQVAAPPATQHCHCRRAGLVPAAGAAPARLGPRRAAALALLRRRQAQRRAEHVDVIGGSGFACRALLPLGGRQHRLQPALPCMLAAVEGAELLQPPGGERGGRPRRPPCTPVAAAALLLLLLLLAATGWREQGRGLPAGRGAGGQGGQRGEHLRCSGAIVAAQVLLAEGSRAGQLLQGVGSRNWRAENAGMAGITSWKAPPRPHEQEQAPLWAEL